MAAEKIRHFRGALKDLLYFQNRQPSGFANEPKFNALAVLHGRRSDILSLWWQPEDQNCLRWRPKGLRDSGKNAELYEDLQVMVLYG